MDRIKKMDSRIKPIGVRYRRLLLSLLLPLLASGSTEYPRMGPDIFDSTARGEDLLSAGLAEAHREGKLLLLFLGANWCPYSRRLNRVMWADGALREMLGRKYVVLHIDANFRRKPPRNAALLARLDNPLKDGLPAFVVLSGDGKQLTTVNAGAIAEKTDEALAGHFARILRETAASAAAHWIARRRLVSARLAEAM